MWVCIHSSIPKVINLFKKNNWAFCFKPSNALYKFCTEGSVVLSFCSPDFFFLFRKKQLTAGLLPRHTGSGLFWLAANSAYPVRGRKLHIDYKAAPPLCVACGGKVSIVLLTSDFSCLVQKEGQEEKGRVLSTVVGQNSFQTCFLGWRDVE